MTKTEKNITIFAVFLALATSLSCIVFLTDLPEQSLVLYRTGSWLAGKQLYRDIFTVQMPMIFYIDALPAYMAAHIGGFTDGQYLFLLGIPLLAYVIHTVLRLIRFHPAFIQDKKKQREFCLLLVTVFITFQNPNYIMDREYLFFLATLPYVLRFMPSLATASIPLSLRITIGVMAGIGFSIKPHCILLFIGVNIAYILWNRSLRIVKSTENIIIYGISTTYLVSVLAFSPEYFHTILPMALATYSGASKKATGLLFFAFAAFAFAIPFADFKPRHQTPYRKDIYYLLLIALFLALYAIANNGWGYTWNPVASLSPLITGFLFWEYSYLKKQHEAQGLPVKEFTFGMRGCWIAFSYNVLFTLVNLFTALAVYLAPLPTGTYDAFIDALTIANNNHTPASFGTISIDFHTWPHIASETGARWDTRFDHLWMLPKLFASDESFRQTHAWVFNDVSAALAQDLDRNKPEMMFVDDSENFYIYKHYIDLVGYFSASPEFARAWSHYRYAGRIDLPVTIAPKTSHHGFYVYQRKVEP